MITTAAAIFVGWILGAATSCLVLACTGLAYLHTTGGIGRAEPGRNGGRPDAGSDGFDGAGSRPAEPDRDALARAFRETGWIDVNTARRYSR